MPASSPDVAAAADALLGWYGREARDLPWRRSADPYRILVSEVMLQQTRVEVVRDRYVDFLARFPDLSALAGAGEDEVLAAWSGMGYYRRARSLRRLALAVLAEHGGRLPAAREALRALPGIGDYTAAAVASIAFGQPALAVDGNVARVLFRLLDTAGDPRRPAVRRRLEQELAGVLATHAPGQLNQALMELGARVCLPRAPRCALCPCARWCRALEAGTPARLPAGRKPAARDVEEAAAVLERDGRLWLTRGLRPGQLGDMWEFPTLDSRLRAAAGFVREGTGAADDDGADSLAAELTQHLRRHGATIATLRRIGAIRHGITDRRITCHVYALRGSPPLPGRKDGAAVEHGWFAHAELGSLPLAASARKILALLQRRGC